MGVCADCMFCDWRGRRLCVGYDVASLRHDAPEEQQQQSFYPAAPVKGKAASLDTATVSVLLRSRQQLGSAQVGLSVRRLAKPPDHLPFLHPALFPPVHADPVSK